MASNFLKIPFQPWTDHCAMDKGPSATRDKGPEQVLGRRIVNYLKNEALIGRIPKQKLQVGISVIIKATVCLYVCHSILLSVEFPLISSVGDIICCFWFPKSYVDSWVSDNLPQMHCLQKDKLSIMPFCLRIMEEAYFVITATMSSLIMNTPLITIKRSSL